MLTPAGRPVMAPARIPLVNDGSNLPLSTFVPRYEEYIARVLAPHWHLHGSVLVLDHVLDVQPGDWPLIYTDQLDAPGAAGYHSDDNGQPRSFIDATLDDPQFTGSHELAEMLKDPTGNSTYAAPSPDPDDDGRMAEYLIELGDPVEDTSFAILIGEEPFSNIITHNYGNSPTGPWDVRGDALTGPRQVAVGGYVSYVIDGEWKQVTNFPGEGFKVRTLGPAGQAKEEGKSLREWVDEHTRTYKVELAGRLARERGDGGD